MTSRIGAQAAARELLNVKRLLSDVNPACGSEREVHIPLVAPTIASSTIWFMADTVSSSLGRAPVRDYFDRGISRELGPKAPIQPHVPALHDEKAHPAASRMSSVGRRRPRTCVNTHFCVRHSIRRPKSHRGGAGQPKHCRKPKTSGGDDRNRVREAPRSRWLALAEVDSHNSAFTNEP